MDIAFRKKQKNLFLICHIRSHLTEIEIGGIRGIHFVRTTEN